MTHPLHIDVPEAELAELRAWARNSEQSVEDLVGEVIAEFMARTRRLHAELEEAMKGPVYTHDEAMAELARRRAMRIAAE